MRGVEVGRAQFRMRLRVEPDRAHEPERLGDPVREFLVAPGLRAVFDEAEHPTVGVLEIGVAAARERAQQVERRGGLAIGLDLPSRIGLARLRRELDVVDDVAAIGRQRDAADRLDVGRARLGELPGDAPHLHDRRRRREGHHHRHLQEDAEEIPNVVCGMLGEAFRAIAPLQQKGLARRRLAQRPFELARLACKNQRRIARELALHRRQRRVIGIDRGLLDRLGPPALGTPIRLRHRPTPLNSRRDAIRPRFLRGSRLYRSARPMAIWTIPLPAACGEGPGLGRPKGDGSLGGPGATSYQRPREDSRPPPSNDPSPLGNHLHLKFLPEYG